ncbi:MAG TPA: hypothetical protein VKU03_05530 [Roseiarcus sp.]|nr:hypothetical protein [Roseiarcus sp.]
MAWRFATDQRASTVEKFAVAAAAIGLLAFLCGTSVEQLASAGRLPTVAFLQPDQYVATRDKPNETGAIDYMATGSINGRIVLDPCTGRRKP